MNRIFMITALLSLPVLAQEVAFEDGFENHVPVILSTPETTASVDTPYSYDIDATDVDGDALVHLLTSGPAGMTIDPVSGLVEWTPGSLGVFGVAVAVSDAQGGAATQAWDIQVLALVDSDGDGLSDDDEVIAGTDPNDPDSDDDGVLDGAEVFEHDTDPLDPDTDGDDFLDGSELAVGTDPLDPDDYPLVPPRLETIAPDTNKSVVGNLRDNLEFLYSGDNPTQSGVAAGTIELKRVALLRGHILTRLGAPLPGVTVSIVGHPEFGSTLSRADGGYDLAVNGGGALTVDYQLSGFLPAQRTLQPAWQEYVVAPDVVLIPLDPVVTPIDLAAPVAIQVARGSVQSDTDGSRQATILFPAGVGAELRMPDDTLLPISNLSVRATEYTVGGSGEMAMPGGLPPTSGYTYAVELSVDEAMAMGAASVDFDQPLPFYVENFLGFPAGTPVPTGYYDRNRGAWVPAPDGLVIAIVSETGGMADIDIDGDEVADIGTALADLGINETERSQLAGLYGPGQSLWRVPIKHFTSWDHNWPIGPPPDAVWPDQNRARTGDSIEAGVCEVGGSIVEAQNQVLRERVHVAGTPFTLNYSSARVPGHTTSRQLEIPVTGASPPQSLKHVKVKVAVAGRVYDFSYEPAPGLVQPLFWDGLDYLGRSVQGSTPANIRISYVYEGVYRTGGGDFSFGQPGSGPIEVEGNRTRADFTLPQEYRVPIGSWDARGVGLGGMTLDVHHSYDPANKVLYRGDGTRRSADGIPRIVTNAVGAVDAQGYGRGCGYLDPDEEIPDLNCGDGLPAREAGIGNQTEHLEFGPDGSLYFVDRGLNRVRRVRPDGIVENFAGTGEDYVSAQDGSVGPNGDGGLAVDAKLSRPRSLAVDKAGNVYIGETTTQARRIRKVDTNGIISTYAGTGDADPPNGPALEVDLNPWDLEVDADGNLYAATTCHIVRIDTAGQARVIAGDVFQCGEFFGDGGPAVQAGISAEGLDLGPDGSIYIADSGNFRVRRIDKSGIIQTVAGMGSSGFSGDGGPALTAQIGFLYDIAVTEDGAMYLPDQDVARLRFVGTDGIIRTIAGLGFAFSESGLNGPATNAWVYPTYVEIGPDQVVYLHQGGDPLIMALKSPLSGFGADEILVPSELGDEIYLFDESGRHLQTIHPLTSAPLLEFGYDAEGRLASVTDGDGNVTTIQRDNAGAPTAITGPFGHVTALVTDAQGFMQTVTNPAGESVEIQSTEDGLITQLTDPRGHASSYSYDFRGRLIQNSDRAMQGQTFERGFGPGEFTVTRTTPMGRTVSYQIMRDAPGFEAQTLTTADGVLSGLVRNLDDASSHFESASGTERAVKQGPDPRFGMHAPVTRETSVTRPVSGTATLTRTRTVELATQNDPLSLISQSEEETIDGNTFTRTYTAAGREHLLTTQEGRAESMTTDSLGRTISRQEAGRHAFTFAYDDRGFIETVAFGAAPEMRVWNLVHNVQGYLESITDPLGRQRSYAYDAVGRTTSTVLADGRTLAYGFDANGNMTSVTPPGRPPHLFTYTPRNRISSITPPAVPGSGTTNFLYNADEQLIEVQRPDNRSVEFLYDSAGRPVERVHKSGLVPTAATTLAYDVIGRLATLTAEGITTAYEYDGSAILSESWSGEIAGSVERTYDSSQRLATESINGANSISYAYDGDDLLMQAGSLAVLRDAVSGSRSGSAMGVVTTSIGFNDFGELEAYEASVSGAPVYSASYVRDLIGRIKQITETVDGVTDVYDVEYDLAGQLTEVSKNTVKVESYAFDSHGNRNDATVYGTSIAAVYDDQDRLQTYGPTSYGYDANGDLISQTTADDTTSYEHNEMGFIEAAVLPDGTRIEYLNDGLHRRVGKYVDGIPEQAFLYADEHRIVAELDGAGSLVSRFVYAETAVPVYMLRSGNSYRIITDHRGSVRLVIDVASGDVAQRLDYDSFGNVLIDSNPGFQPFGYAGGIYDPMTGLVRFGAREYDARTGRWLTKDPAWFAGLDTNLYRYALGDPVNYVDRTGKPPNPLREAWDELTEEIVDPKNPETGQSMLADDPEARAEHEKTQREIRKSHKNTRARLRPEVGNWRRLPGKDVLAECFDSAAEKGRFFKGAGSTLLGAFGQALSVINFIKLGYEVLVNDKEPTFVEICNAMNPLPTCGLIDFETQQSLLPPSA